MIMGVAIFGIGVYISIGFLAFEPFLDYIEEGLELQEKKRMTKLRALKVLLMQTFWPITLLIILATGLYDWWANLPDQ